jgi:hypothetical protein
VLAVPIQAAWAQAEDEWRFTFTPYLGLAGLDGDVGVHGREVAVDASFGDVVENLDFAATAAVEAHHGRWALGSDLMYMDLGDDGDIAVTEPDVDSFDVDASTFMANPLVSYRVTRPGPVAAHLSVGARYWHIKNEIKLAGPRRELVFEDSQGWLDPIVGARVRAAFDEHWFGLALGDIGGFGVGSDFTWQALGMLGYTFDSEGRYSLLAGWRQLDVDYESDEGFLWDVGMGGPAIGFMFAW